MNTERTSYRPEDDDSDDGTVSFGQGAAFRPVPRIERPAPQPKPLMPRPRLSEGILLFDRSSKVVEHIKNDAENKEDDDDENKEMKVKVPVAAESESDESAPISPRPASEVEKFLIDRTEASDALALHDAIEDDSNTATAIHTAELKAPAPAADQENIIDTATPETVDDPQDTHLPDIGEFNAVVPSLPAIETVPDSEPPKPVESTTVAAPEWTAAATKQNDNENDPYAAAQSPVYAAARTAPTHSAYRTTGRGSGGGVGPTPPHPPTSPMGNLPPSHNNPPQPPSPNHGGGPSGPGSVNYNANVAPQAPATIFESTPLPVAHRKGSVLPYVAVLAENIARKRADRKLKKELGSRIDDQNKLQEQANANQLRLERQQQEMLNEQRRQTLLAARQSRGREWGIFSPTYGSDESAQSSQLSAGAGSSERPFAGGGQPEFRQVTSAQAQEQQLVAPGMEAIPAQPHQRVEHSAWHNIVVDEKGQEVAGALQYGEGFRRERQQEIIPDHTGDSVTAVAAGADEVTVAPRSSSGLRSRMGGGGGSGGSAGGGFGYGGGTSGPSYAQQNLPSGMMTTPGLPQGTPTHVDPQHQLPAHQTKKTASAPGPLFWVMMLLILAAFFGAALI